MNNSVRKITDGAMMCAIVGLILVINRQFAGLLEELFLFLFPLPMVFYATKYGRKDSWLILVAIILLTIVLGTPQTLFYVGSEAFLGLVYGAGVHDKKDSRKLLFMAIAIGIFVNVVSTIIYASFFGYNLTAEIAEYETVVKQVLDESGMRLVGNMNLKQMITTIVIMSVVLTGVMQGCVTHILSRLLLHRLGFTLPPSIPLALYFPKKWTGYFGIGCLVLYYFTIYKSIDSEMLTSLLQGIGLCGTVYLCFMGGVAMVVSGGLRKPKSSGLYVILSFFLIMLLMLPMALVGFLYITTSWHEKMLRGAIHVTKNE